MKPDELFLHADAAIREVIDQVDAADFPAPVPKQWSELESPPCSASSDATHTTKRGSPT